MVKPAKIPVVKENQKVLHPNSRKAKRLARKVSRENKLKKKKLTSNMRYQVLGAKLMWFKENCDTSMEVYTPKDLHELIEKYINRFDEELEQINLKHKVGQRGSRQYASREDNIRITKEKELGEYKSCGIEIVDLLNAENMKYFKTWNGELKLLSNIKVRKFTKQLLESGETVSPPEEIQGSESEVSDDNEDMKSECDSDVELMD